MSGSGISWAICKSAPRCRQITTPAPHHSGFYRPDALPAAQPTASKHWRHNSLHKNAKTLVFDNNQKQTMTMLTKCITFILTFNNYTQQWDDHQISIKTTEVKKIVDALLIEEVLKVIVDVIFAVNQNILYVTWLYVSLCHTTRQETRTTFITMIRLNWLYLVASQTQYDTSIQK